MEQALKPQQGIHLDRANRLVSRLEKAVKSARARVAAIAALVAKPLVRVHVHILLPP